MNHPGWILVIIGVIIAAIGLVWVFAPSTPWLLRMRILPNNKINPFSGLSTLRDEV